MRYPSSVILILTNTQPQHRIQFTVHKRYAAIHLEHQLHSPTSSPVVSSPLIPTTRGGAFVVHDIGQVQPS